MPRPVFLGEFEQFVLCALLLVEDQPSALRLRDELTRLCGRPVSRGALYRTLDRLHQKGLVAVTVEKGGPERRGHLRRLYTVTSAGRAKVRAARDTMTRMWRQVAEAVR